MNEPKTEWRPLKEGDIRPEGYQWRVRGTNHWETSKRAGKIVTNAETDVFDFRAPAKPAKDGNSTKLPIT